VIGLVWPEPSATAAGQRMLQLLHFFKAQHYHITFGSSAQESAHSFDLATLGITKLKITVNSPEFDTFISELNPDIVVFDRFITEEQFGWRVSEFAPNAIKMLDTEDLHSLRATRQEAVKANASFAINKWKQNAITLREIASIYRCDCSLIISEFEMQLLEKELGIDPSLLLQLPFLLPAIAQPKNQLGLAFEERKDFVCIGNGKHAPNVDAILWMKNEIWDGIRMQLPDTKLHIYGAYLPQQITQLHDPKTGFHIHGRVENAAIVMGKARVSLAPLRFGAGIKGKLVMAMQCGTVNVTTQIGAEGMHKQLPWNGSIANEADQIVAAAVNLYMDKKGWLQAQRNGITIINECYNKDYFERQLSAKISNLYRNLQAHRSTNFMGCLLQHHTLMSTKYMAKWIEAKNAS